MNLDSCPSCKRPDIRPRTVIADAYGTEARYRCPCGKTWSRDVDTESEAS